MKTLISLMIAVLFATMLSVAHAGPANPPFQKTVWASYLGYEIATQNRFDTVSKIALLNRAYEENPAQGPALVLDPIRHAEREYRYFMPESATKAVERMIDLIGLAPGGMALSLATRTALDLARYQSEHAFAAMFSPAAARNLSAGERLGLLGGMHLELEKAATYANDPTFAQALAEITDEVSGGVTSSHSPEEILILSPQFAEHARLGELVSTVGGQNARLGAVERMAKNELKRLSHNIDELQSQVEALAKSQPDPMAAVRALQADAAKLEAARKAAEHQRLEEQAVLEGSRASLFILSTVARIGGNPAAARAIDTVGSSALQIAHGISEFKKFSAEGLSDTANAMGAAVLTGNVLGAVTQIVSLFENSQSAEASILYGIQDLQRQVSALADRMEERFDHIDRSLVAISREMSAAFARLDASVLDTRDGVRDIQDRLREQSLKLSSVEERVVSLIRTGFGRDLVDTAEKCMRKLNFESAFECLGQLSLQATEHAKDVISSPPAPESIEGIEEALASLPKGLEQGLNLVSEASYHLLHDSRLSPFTRKIDVATWAVAAEAYLSALDKLGPYRKWVVQVVDQDGGGGLKRILAEGEALENFFDKLSGESRFSQTLPGKALTHYRDTLQRIAKRMNETREIFQYRHAGGYDLFGGTAQPNPPTAKDYKAIEGNQARMDRCRTFEFLDSTSPGERAQAPTTLKLPTDIESALPTEARMAARLGLGTATACVSGLGWADVRDCITSPSQKERKCGKMSYRVDLQLSGNTVARWTIKSREIVWHFTVWTGNSGGYGYNAYSKVIPEQWEGAGDAHRTPLGSEYSSYSQDSAAVAQVAELVTKQLAAKASELVQQILAENRFERELSGAAGLVRGLVALNLPRTVHGNDFARALLLGPEGLADGLTLRKRLASNPRSILDFDVELEKRADALEDFLTGAAGVGTARPIERAQEQPQDHPWISGTMRKLRLAQKRAELEKPALSVDQVLGFFYRELEKTSQ